MIVFSYYVLLLFHEFTLTYFHNLLSNRISDIIIIIIIITVIIITTTSITNTVDISDDLSNFTSSIELKK
jgi:hypothetical protein